jgi:hypothetical protein
MKKTFAFFISICFLQCAMDYNVVSNITNTSGDTVMVTVLFNKPYFDSVFVQDKKRVLLSINNIDETTGLPYSFDSAQLSTTYLVPNDTSLRVSETKGGYGVIPSHNSLYKIMIYKKDLTPIYSIKNLDAAFKKKSNTEWIYIIH